MVRRGKQLDIFEHDPARLAKAWRAAAEQALQDVQFPPSLQQERHDYYMAEAVRLEDLAALCSTDTAKAA